MKIFFQMMLKEFVSYEKLYIKTDIKTDAKQHEIKDKRLFPFILNLFFR